MEYGNAETAHSVAFSLHTARTLMAGMNNKQIRLFDLRGTYSISASLSVSGAFLFT